MVVTADETGENVAGPDDETAPLPVILPRRPPVQASQPNGGAKPSGNAQPVGSAPEASRIRGPFEPVDRPPHQPAPSATDPETRAKSPSADPSAPPSTTVPKSPAAGKLEQIKDLYLTAEAIGDDALARHFEQVSERQRQLIREYFDRGTKGKAEAEG